ncbi:hypothetical protein SAMN02745166_02845 [Prosthecobacter debontii]|uniref:General secretion pathway protein M n=1 Tax=Prosthecobacter debontii TaxID=48467 RepID=A0A1T4YA67_9BACT|nr:hypothetical protein [Prosthecobacter debontii]SKA98707.1 hypothetical protein SAMN02745166_02845 [Prosthecobacter debontii]
MAQKLTSREKNLLLLCVSVLVFMAFAILVNDFMQRRTAALQKIATLQAQKSENDTWMADRAFWDKRRNWLVEKMPTTESLGRAQGQLLEDLQNQALEYGITSEQPTLPPLAAPTESYREVTVSIRLRGDQTTVLRWLSTLQSPEKFQAVRVLDLEIDTRSREKTPQVVCNLTVARWFKPEVAL